MEDDAEDASFLGGQDSFDKDNFFLEDEEEEEYEEEYSEEQQGMRVKRAASTTNNYIHVSAVGFKYISVVVVVVFFVEHQQVNHLFFSNKHNLHIILIGLG